MGQAGIGQQDSEPGAKLGAGFTGLSGSDFALTVVKAKFKCPAVSKDETSGFLNFWTWCFAFFLLTSKPNVAATAESLFVALALI